MSAPPPGAPTKCCVRTCAKLPGGVNMKPPVWNVAWGIWVSTCENITISSTGHVRASHHVAMYDPSASTWVTSTRLSLTAQEWIEQGKLKDAKPSAAVAVVLHEGEASGQQPDQEQPEPAPLQDAQPKTNQVIEAAKTEEKIVKRDGGTPKPKPLKKEPVSAPATAKETSKPVAKVEQDQTNKQPLVLKNSEQNASDTNNAATSGIEQAPENLPETKPEHDKAKAHMTLKKDVASDVSTASATDSAATAMQPSAPGKGEAATPPKMSKPTVTTDVSTASATDSAATAMQPSAPGKGEFDTPPKKSKPTVTTETWDRLDREMAYGDFLNTCENYGKMDPKVKTEPPSTPPRRVANGVPSGEQLPQFAEPPVPDLRPDAKQQFVQRAMVAYADVVEADGFFLGLLDLALLCKHYKKEGFIVYNEKGSTVQVQSLHEKIREHLGCASCDLELSDLFPEVTGQWHFLAVKADYKPVYHNECNHWLPIWTMEQLGPDFEVERRRAAAAISESLFGYQKRVAEIMEAEDDETDAEDEFETALDLVAMMERQDVCFTQLFEKNLCPMDVPADGNCGVWSVWCLRDRDAGGDCSGVHSPDIMMAISKLRTELKDAWIAAADNQLWQTFWDMWGLQDELSADAIAACKGLAVPKAAQEAGPRTPPREHGKPVQNDEGVKKSPIKHVDPKKLSQGKASTFGARKSEKELALVLPHEHGGQDDDAGAEDLMPKRGIKRKPHPRSAWQKPVTNQETRLKAVRCYLGGIGIDWPSWQRFHLRREFRKKVDKEITCSGGGFKALQTTLLAENEVKCATCKAMMDCHGFSKEKLQEQLDSASVVRPFRVERGEVAVPAGPDEPAEPAELAKPAEPSDEEEPAPALGWQAWVASQGPLIELLPLGSFGKKLPYRCKACTSARWPMGRVGDLNIPTLNAVKHFLLQHTLSSTHLANVKKMEAIQQGVEVPDTMECMGVSLTDPRAAQSLWKYKPEVELWCSMANFADCPNTKHSYTFNATNGTWLLRAETCEKTMPATKKNKDLGVCSACMKLGDSHGIVRCAQRFAVKYYAAQLLSAKLFGGEEFEKETFEKLSATPLYQNGKAKVKEILRLDAGKLQQTVRGAWKCDGKPSAECQRFIDIVVNPCLQCSVASIPNQLVHVSATFQSILNGNKASDQEMLNLQIASAAMTGKLESHPLLIGLCLQSMRLLEKQSRGIETMVGRRSAESDVASSLIRDAGLQMAVATANTALVKEFGLSSRCGDFKYEELYKQSLPSPALALNYPEDLERNFVIADQRLPRRETCARRRFMLCFDCTYLQRGLNQMELKGEHLLVGGTWLPTHPENSTLKIDPKLNLKTVKKSKQLLQFLLWDPSANKRIPLSMAEIPVEHNFAGPLSGQRAGLYYLEIVGTVLKASNGLVKGIIFDAAAAHGMVRRAVHSAELASKGLLEGVPWFSQLSHKALPESVLPRMPIRMAFIQNEPVWALPGHANKNCGGQIASHLRTIWVGSYWCDLSKAACSFSMPPAAFGRHSAMSDKLHALMMSPFFLIEDVECSIPSMVPHWALRGAMILNTCVAMCVAPLLHQKMELRHRAEVAISGFLSLDLFAMLSREVEKSQRLPSGSAFLAKQTRENIQAASLAGLLVCLSKDEEMEPYRRGFGRLSELPVEHFFGHLRVQHANAQMSCRAFFRSSARHMLRCNKDLNKQSFPKKGGDAPLTAGEYRVCAKKAWDATLEMVSKVSSRSVEELESMYSEACRARVFDAGGELHASPGELDQDEAADLEQLEPDPENPCMDFLEQVVQETKEWAEPMECEGQGDGAAGEIDLEKCAAERDLDGVPDKDVLEKLLQAQNSLEPFGSELYGSPSSKADADYMPKSLSEAMAIKGDIFNKLFRLSVQLRSGPGGADCDFIRNPLLCRRSSRKLSWYQWNNHVISKMSMEQGEGEEYKARTSRLAKWRELSAQASRELEVHTTHPERLVTGNVVLMKLPGKGKQANVDIGMVLTVWQGVKDPKPCSSPVPINGCVAFRAVLLDLVDPNKDPPQEWFCTAKSPAHVMRLESLVCILDVEKTYEPLDASGRFRVVLTKESADVLSRVDELELWMVGHTMVRGAPKTVDGEETDFVGGKTKAKGTKRKRKTEEEDSDLPSLDTMTAETFRRSAQGRAAVRAIVRELRRLDDLVFAKEPIFDLEGYCTLKAAGADSCHWDDMLAVSASVFECVNRLVKVPAEYGDAVYKHLHGIHGQLSRSQPVRTGWQRFLREVVDFLNLQKQKALLENQDEP